MACIYQIVRPFEPNYVSLQLIVKGLIDSNLQPKKQILYTSCCYSTG